MNLRTEPAKYAVSPTHPDVTLLAHSGKQRAAGHAGHRRRPIEL
jgi:hypothetical protein